MQSYEQQVQILCQQLQEVCGSDLKPQALTPHAWPAGSGSAICQLHTAVDVADNSAGNRQPTERLQLYHTTKHSDKAAGRGEHSDQSQQQTSRQHAALTKIQQLLSSNQQLLITFLVDTWTQQQQQVHQMSVGEPPPAATQAAGAAALADSRSVIADQPSSTAPATAGAAVVSKPPSYTCSSWMHPGLQQYLFELERGPWVTPATAGAAAHPSKSAAAAENVSPVNNTYQLSAATAAAADGGEDDASTQSSSSSSKWLLWLKALHPTAAVAQNGVIQRTSTLQQQQQQRQLSNPASRNKMSTIWKEVAKGKSRNAPAAAGVSVSTYLSQGLPGCSIHPNIQPVLLLATAASSSSSSNVCCMVTEHHTTDLASLLRFSPSSLGGDWYIRFLLYQLLQGLDTLHNQGLPLRGFSLDQIHQVLPGWIQLLAKPSGTLVSCNQQQQQQQRIVAWPYQAQQQQQQVFIVREPHYTLPQLTEMWRLGVISNLEYLLWLNAAAGRRWGDRRRHPLVPWVIDFSVKPDLNAHAFSSSSSSSVPPGWRDLGLSQYRRIKGDAQLDQTYAMSAAAAGISSSSSTAVPPADQQYTNASSREPWTWPNWGSSSSSNAGDLGSTTSAVPPHHISNEPMSELSYAIYMARRLPVELLIKLVRRSFQPEEFPCSIDLLYHSSPDEALPQFYTDPQVFKSVHQTMCDLAVPDWANSAQEFVNIHRAALESDYVSANLHKWIDLNFGVALSGSAGLAAKNIHLRTQQQHGGSSSSAGGGGYVSPAAAVGGSDGGSSSSSGGWLPVTHGVCQLLDAPHPPRCSSSSGSSSRNAALNSRIVSDTAARSSQNGQSAAAAAAAAAAAGEDQTLYLLDTADIYHAPSPDQLAACWRNIASLEAAAATGSWQCGLSTAAPAAAAAAGSNVAASQAQWRRQQQQQQPGAVCFNRMELLPAAAADVAAVGQIAMHLYQQQQQQQPVALSRSTGSMTAGQGMSSSSSKVYAVTSFDSRSAIAPNLISNGLISGDGDELNHQITPSDLRSSEINLGPALSSVPAPAALFIQQCSSGQLSVRGLLHSPFFPVWMEGAWKFMVKMLYSQQLHSEHQQQTAHKPYVQDNLQSGDASDNQLQPAPVCHNATKVSSSSSSGSSNAQGAVQSTVCWCIQDAFESLAAAAAGPTGELYQLAQAPEAMQLCLPAIMHVIKCRLLQSQANARTTHALTQQQQQQHEVQEAVDYVNSVCVVLLRLASVLPPLLLQQHLLPLLQDMLATEQQPCNSTNAPPAAVQENAQCTQQQQQRLNSSESVRVSACRRAVLQPLLWQILLAKLPQQQLLQVLLPPLLLAALEPQHDWMCPCCIATEFVAYSMDSITAAAAAAAAGDPSGFVDAYTAATAANRKGLQNVTGIALKPQQKQQSSTLVQLAGNCLAVLAESLPFPVVCQHMLRPLLIALPWAGSTARTARDSNALCNALHHTTQNATQNACFPINGAAVALQAIGSVLPARLAARCVFKKATQLALLPLLHSSNSSSSSSDGVQGNNASQAVRVGRYTVTALPVLEGLLEHVLPVLEREFVLPVIGDFLIPAHVPPAAAAAGSSALPSVAAAAAGEESQTVLANSGNSRVLAPSKSAGSNSSSNSMSTAASNAAAASTPTTLTADNSSSSSVKQQQQQQQQHVTDFKLHKLPELLLLLPPDVKAISSSPMLYPRIVALYLCALEQAAENAAASSSNNVGVHALTATITSSSSSSSSLTGIITNWLLPQVLLPLLSPPMAAVWQVDEDIRRAYWRSVLLLYAAAVRVLGLKEVRESVPAWHSVEVWLSSETGWEIQQPVSPMAADSSSSINKNTDALPHPMHLLSLFAQRDMLEATNNAAAAAAAAAATERLSGDDDTTASSSSTMRNDMMSRIVLRQSSTDEGLAAAAAAVAANGDAALRIDIRAGSGLLNGSSNNTAASSSSSNNLSGRVSSLLRRITEEKVVRRNLNTTHDFMQGVGWSKPRPASATNAYANGDNASKAAAAAAAAAEDDSRTAKRALSAPLAAAAAIAEGFSNLPSELKPGSSSSSNSSDAAAAAAAAGVPAQSHWALDLISDGTTGTEEGMSNSSDSFSAAKPVPAAAAAAAATTPRPAAAQSSGTRSWAAELSELRLLLESPAKSSSERGPSAGKEWFWLLQPQNEPSHLLPSIHNTAAASSSSSSGISGSSRPWRSVYGCWWEEGWNLGAQVLHGWPAHKDRLRALAVDPGERWVVTAGRSGIRDASGSVMTSSSSPVVRVWELSDAETKVQYSGHTAAVHQVSFLGCGCSAVASLDVSGAIHVWSRSTGAQLNSFIPEEGPTATTLLGIKTAVDVPPPAAAAAAAAVLNEPTAAAATVSATDDNTGSSRTSSTTDAAAAAAAAAGVPGAAAAVAASFLAQHQCGSFYQRGCSSSRGWQGQPTLYTSRQLAANAAGATAGAAAARNADAAAAAAAGGSVVAGGPSAALALGGCLGYTCMLNPTSNVCPYAYSDPISVFGGSSSSLSGGGSSSSDGWQSSFGVLLAGTADGRVCCLDVETGALLDDMVAHWEPRSLWSPYYMQQQQQLLTQQQQQQNSGLYGISGWEDPSTSVISAVSCSNSGFSSSSGGSSGVRGLGSWIAAGSGSGRIMLLDSRSGVVLASWQAHSQRVSQLQGLVGFRGDWQLLSCSQDKTLKLWDLRLLRQSRCWSGSSSSSSGCNPLATYKGSKDGIEGFVVYQDAAIVYGGPNLGLAPLTAAASSSGPQQQQQPGWSAAAAAPVYPVRMTGLRGGNARGSGGISKSGRDGGLGSKGLSSSAAIVGLGLLPSSKLLVVGQEDGQLRIVR